MVENKASLRVSHQRGYYLLSALNRMPMVLITPPVPISRCSAMPSWGTMPERSQRDRRGTRKACNQVIVGCEHQLFTWKIICYKIELCASTIQKRDSE